MKPTVHRETCGTEQGYRAHTKRGETRCQHMLKLNQGHGYILQAIGYQGRLQALEKRMRQNGHPDLARWAVNLEREAA